MGVDPVITFTCDYCHGSTVLTVLPEISQPVRPRIDVPCGWRNEWVPGRGLAQVCSDACRAGLLRIAEVCPDCHSGRGHGDPK
jgi:hypothetical protein